MGCCSVTKQSLEFQVCWQRQINTFTFKQISNAFIFQIIKHDIAAQANQSKSTFQMLDFRSSGKRIIPFQGVRDKQLVLKQINQMNKIQAKVLYQFKIILVILEEISEKSTKTFVQIAKKFKQLQISVSFIAIVDQSQINSFLEDFPYFQQTRNPDRVAQIFMRNQSLYSGTKLEKFHLPSILIYESQIKLQLNQNLKRIFFIDKEIFQYNLKQGFNYQKDLFIQQFYFIDCKDPLKKAKEIQTDQIQSKINVFGLQNLLLVASVKDIRKVTQNILHILQNKLGTNKFHFYNQISMRVRSLSMSTIQVMPSIRQIKVPEPNKQTNPDNRFLKMLKQYMEEIKKGNNKFDFQRLSNISVKLLTNIYDQSDPQNYRRLKLTNKAIKQLFLDHQLTLKIFNTLGFIQDRDGTFYNSLQKETLRLLKGQFQQASQIVAPQIK